MKSMVSANVFQIKTKPHGIERLNEFLEKGFIAIGWPGIGDLTEVDREEIRTRLKEKYGYVGQQLAYTLGAVNTFVNVMSKGDIVLVRDGEYVHIGIIGPYRYVEELDNDDDGMCHQRATKWIATVKRSDLNADVQSLVANRNSVSKFPHPTEMAELDKVAGLEKYVSHPTQSTEWDRGSLPQANDRANDLNKAWSVLTQALDSSNEMIRVQAAIAILNHAMTSAR
ncbi:MAG: hypothetical protein K6T81_11080 [Alicyclobacillus macrosporangiidus]|uniref:hypothetical protein n=1 Tax=Alicyclobacillus macrosporangiidus TaxID=392015 RepID=UPI0026F20919|nr:hypothetical protein [Alicyclobacillus macrosporangiidus]MCL6599267.1 hypothetical protein [Alicyclobacillus macrosporangiidus]